MWAARPAFDMGKNRNRGDLKLRHDLRAGGVITICKEVLKCSLCTCSITVCLYQKHLEAGTCYSSLGLQSISRDVADNVNHPRRLDPTIEYPPLDSLPPRRLFARQAVMIFFDVYIKQGYGKSYNNIRFFWMDFLLYYFYFCSIQNEF